MHPRARDEELFVSEVADEVLVYDLTRFRAHALNRTSAAIWRHCDGQRTVGELAALAGQELDAPVDERVVWLALGQLSRANLLAEKVVPPAGVVTSRRAFVRRAGVALVGGALVLPHVASITAPLAAQVQSGGGPGDCCTTQSECNLGTCQVSDCQCLNFPQFPVPCTQRCCIEDGEPCNTGELCCSRTGPGGFGCLQTVGFCIPENGA